MAHSVMHRAARENGIAHARIDRQRQSQLPLAAGIPPKQRDQNIWSHTDGHTAQSGASADFKLKRFASF
jgi:hypothetical protein